MGGLRAVDLLGWAATAVFVASYFFRKPQWLRRIQMAGALMWVAYGFIVHAMPVVVANLLVLGAAVWTARQGSGGETAVGRGPVGVSTGSRWSRE